MLRKSHQNTNTNQKQQQENSNIKGTSKTSYKISQVLFKG